MPLRYLLTAFFLFASATGVQAEGAVGTAMERCEKGVFVTAPNGAVARILSDLGGVCAVTFPNGAEGIVPGGGGVFVPSDLIRQAAPLEALESGAFAGGYLCTITASQDQFRFELASDGHYTLRESAGTYENPDVNSIRFIDGELDGANGWMNKGVIGVTMPGGASEIRCVIEQ